MIDRENDPVFGFTFGLCISLMLWAGCVMGVLWLAGWL